MNVYRFTIFLPRISLLSAKVKLKWHVPFGASFSFYLGILLLV